MVGTPEVRTIVARRNECLEHLAERPLTKPELVEVADTSRSTVDRAIDDLQSVGLVERQGSHYATTMTGDLVREEFYTYRRRLADLHRCEPVLSALPDGVDVDPAILEGADVHVTKPFAPAYPIRRSVEIVERADRMRGYGPVVLPQYVDVLRTAIIENDLELELVFTPTVVEMLEDAHEELRELFAAENTTVYRTDEEPFYALWIAEMPTGDHHSGIVSCTGEGVKGAIVNDSDAMNEWACGTYAGYREGATEVERLPSPAAEDGTAEKGEAEKGEAEKGEAEKGEAEKGTAQTKRTATGKDSAPEKRSATGNDSAAEGDPRWAGPDAQSNSPVDM